MQRTLDEVYSTAPHYVKADPKYKTKQKAMLKVWFDNHIGLANAVSHTEIAKRFAMKEGAVRHLVAEMVCIDRIPIVTGKEGYYKASSAEELQLGSDYLFHKNQGLFRRIEALESMKSLFK